MVVSYRINIICVASGFGGVPLGGVSSDVFPDILFCRSHVIIPLLFEIDA